MSPAAKGLGRVPVPGGMCRTAGCENAADAGSYWCARCKRARALQPPASAPSEQLGLLDPAPAPAPAPLGSTRLPRARKDAPVESHQAAHAAGKRLTLKQRAVLAVLERYGPMTDEQLVDQYAEERRAQLARGFGEVFPDMDANSIRPRRGDLVRLERVRDTGRRAKTARGNPAAIWAAVPVVPEGQG